MWCDILTCKQDAKLAVTLDNGEEYYVCDSPDCMKQIIEENAMTSNPVHSIEEIGEEN